MGEYATHNGESIKIGTCEDMYYLRADQAEKVQPESGNVDPLRDAAGIRFRFPFPDEDQLEPGCFDKYNRSLPLYVEQSEIPAFDHYSVQFRADVGYLMSLPCPEAKSYAGPVVHKNGWVGGTARLVQQRVWEGALVVVVACPGCDARYRLETLEMAEPYILAARSTADRLEHAATIDPRRGQISPRDWDSSINFWHMVADRMTVGYTNPPAWVREATTA
jgi:hypothetical protein